MGSSVACQSGFTGREEQSPDLIVLDVRGRSRGERKAVAQSFLSFVFHCLVKRPILDFYYPKTFLESRECIGRTLFTHLSY
jgi:hypothetical protein